MEGRERQKEEGNPFAWSSWTDFIFRVRVLISLEATELSV
jgi:hypothetical protein